MTFAVFFMLGIIFACANGPGWTAAAVVCFVVAALVANRDTYEGEDDDSAL